MTLKVNVGEYKAPFHVTADEGRLMIDDPRLDMVIDLLVSNSDDTKFIMALKEIKSQGYLTPEQTPDILSRK